jgi:hypothetical protein
MEAISDDKFALLSFLTRKALAVKDLLAYELYRVCGQSDISWRYLANWKPWIAYQRTRKPLDAIQADIVAQLERDGIAITSVEEFFGNSRLFEELEIAVQQRERDMADEIHKAREGRGQPNRVKSYLIKLLGALPVLDPNDIFARLALHPRVLDVVNGYYGMFARLRHYNVWHNFPSQDEPRESQLWHRDPEDRYILKMFVYLTDVDHGAGPLSYAPGTHARGAVTANPQAHIVHEGPRQRETQRTNDDQMRVLVPEEKWLTATGPKGMVVFADTRGYHKGGLVRERDRIAYLCTFTSRASTLLNDMFERKLPVPAGADRATTFAIEG